MSIVKGYKVFNPDWTCRGFKFEVGKVFEEDVMPECCKRGFHFCRKLSDCFSYYDFNINNKVAEVEALGEVSYKKGNSKCCTNKIKIIRELTWNEVLELVNIGNYNTGYCNTGNYNTGNRNGGNFNTGNYNIGNYNIGNYNIGDYNTSNYNTGDCNTGYCNTGNYNTGNHNTGDCNNGHCNTGNYNTGNYNGGNYNTGNCNNGDCNSGNHNTGDFNSGDYSSGVFNTKQHCIYMFDKPTDWTCIDWKYSEARTILSRIKTTEWVEYNNMTEEEKKIMPEAKLTNGYLKEYDFKTACKNLWKKLNEKEKEVITQLPNFDKDKFKLITGIDIEEDK